MLFLLLIFIILIIKIVAFWFTEKKVFLHNNHSQQVRIQNMQNKSTSSSKRLPPPKPKPTLTPKAASSSSQSVNTFKDKKEDVRPDDSETLQKKINELLQLKFSKTIDEKIAGEKIKKMFDPLKPTDLKICFQQCARLALNIKLTEFKEWKDKNIKIIAEALQQLEKSNQYLKLTNKKKKQSQILPEEDDQQQKGQYYNLMMKKRKQDIIEDYQRIRKHDTLLQKIIQGQILTNFTKFYKIIPLQRRIINEENEEHYDPQGIKELENICKCDNLEPIQVSTIEQLLIKEKRMSIDIKRYLQSIAEVYKQIKNLEKNMKQSVKTNSLEQSYDQLIKLWILIQNSLNIINVSLFIRLIKLNKQQNNQIQGKNIALLIGPSGAGKTTIMLRMLGYQMCLAIDNLTGLKTLMPKKKIAPQHNGLISRPGAQSVTQTIFAAELQKIYLTQLQNLLICDTPGFFDSSGPVIDLVNGISLINAIKKAKSVKPIIVISANMVGQRLEGVKKLGKIVSNLLTKLDKNEEGLAITFIFNKFSNQQQFLRLEPGVKNILQNLSQTDKINTKYVRFLQLLHQTLFKKMKNKYILFKPFEFDIKSTIEILQQNLIQNPGQVFQYSHSIQSVQVLQLFMKKKMQLINFYLDYNPKDSYFHLKQLKLLIDHLKIGQYENEYKAIKKNIEEKSLEYFTSFKYLLSEQTWNDNISDGQIIESKNMYDKLMSLQIFREQRQCDLYSHKDFELIINSLKTIFKDIKNKIDKLQDLSADERNITKKMQLFCRLYGQQAFSNDLKNEIFKRYDNITNQLEKLLKINNFQSYKQSFYQYKQIEKLIVLFNNDDGKISIKQFDILLETKYRKISDNFKASLTQINQKLFAQQLSIFPEQINKNLILLQQIQQISEQLFSTGKKQRQQSIKTIKTTILKLQSDFKVFLKSKNPESKNKMYAILANLQVIKRFQKLAKFVQAIINNIKEIIETLIDDYKTKFTQIFQKLENGQICSSFSHVYTYIYALTNYPKLLETDSKQKEVQRFIQQIQQDFMKYIKKIIQKTRTINTTLKSILKNDNLTIICNRLRQLKYAQNAFSSKTKAYECFDDLKDQIEKFITLCEQKREAPLNQLKKVLQHAQQQSDISSTIHKVCQDINKYNQYVEQLGELLTNKIKPQFIQSIIKQKKQYFLKIHKIYTEEYSKIQNKYIWELSGHQEASYRKRMSNLLYFQESARQDLQIQLLYRQNLQKIYQQHIKVLSKSIEFYSNDQKQQTPKNKLQIGQILKRYEIYLDQQDKKQLITLLKRYQNNEYEANEIELEQIFSQKFLDYGKLQAFYNMNKEGSKIAIDIQSKMQVYDNKIYKWLKQIIDNPPKIEEIDNHQKEITLLEHAVQLINRETYFNSIFVEEALFLTDKNLIKTVLKPFQEQLNNIFDKINFSIIKIDFDSEYIIKKINLFEKLQKMILVIFNKNYTDWKQNFFTISMVRSLKNIPVFDQQPFYKYLQLLSAQIQARRSKNITGLIEPKTSESIKFYPSLNPQHKKQYLEPLLLQFQNLKQGLIKDGKKQDYNNRQRQLINLFPTKQLQQRYQEELDTIYSHRNNSLEQLSLKIAIGLQEKQLNGIFKAFKEKEQLVNQDHIAAVAKRIGQRYEQAQLNDSDLRSLEQQLEPLQKNHYNLNKHTLYALNSAKSKGQEKLIQSNLKKTDIIFQNIGWESPLMISSVKERQLIQNKFIQLLKSNMILGRYKQSVSNSQMDNFNRILSKVFKQLINQYQLSLPKEIDRVGKIQLMNIIKSKLFMKVIINNVHGFMKGIEIYHENKVDLFQNQTENDWLNKLIKSIKQYQIETYQFYRQTIIQFQKNNNQYILKEKFLRIKHSFLFLINIEEIFEKIQQQKEFKFFSFVTNHSCIKQLKKILEDLLLKAGQEINNCKSIHKEHNLQKTVFFSQFLSLWEDQHNNKFGFVEHSSLLFQDIVTKKLQCLIRQTLVYINGKSINSYIKQNLQSEQLNRIISPASKILNILIIFLEFKQKIVKHKELINQNMNIILSSLPTLSKGIETALNQQLMQRQKQLYISILCTNYKQFKHVKQMQFSQKTRTKIQQYLQKFLKENNNDQSQFYKQASNTVFNQYKKLISIHQQNPTKETKIELIASIKSDVNIFPVQKIIGKLFAIYSIIKNEDSLSKIYFQPHVSQVIATLTLLQIDEITLELKKNLVEIPTGQGKSIVLGICACYLALRGFQVYHSCYSPILIHRDKMEFTKLYKSLKIQSKVFYGSFQETCEKILPQQFKELAIQQIKKHNLTVFWQWFTTIISQKIQSFKDLFRAKLEQLSPIKKVLLLDEVDVLLSPDYYNKIYTPTLDITDNFLEDKKITTSGLDLITNLFKQINDKIKNNKNYNFKKIEQFPATQKIVEIFPQTKDILFNIIKQIIVSARNNRKIQQITKNYSFIAKFKSGKCNSYQQMIAGVQLFTGGNISNDELKRSLKIKIKLCELSYTELPKYFSSIIGASGTLKILTERKKTTLINQYQMQGLYHLPTIYKQKKFDLQRVCIEKSKSQHSQTLTKNITNHLHKGGDRAVLVLFEDQKDLKQFKNNYSFKKITDKHTVNILIFNKERFNYDEVSKNIIKTTLPNTVTLATKQFGRGIDFQDEVGLQQGLFVIIAFIPDSLQEYIQAKGRTSRAGRSGKVFLCSYKEQNIQDQYEDNNDLDKLFIRKQQCKMNKIKDSIQQVKLRHKDTLEVYTNDKSSVIDYLQKINKFDCPTIRIILGIQITLQDREQILKQFVDKIKVYENFYSQQKQFQLKVICFTYGNYIDLTRQMKNFDRQIHGKIQNKSQQLKIDEILKFVQLDKKTRKIEKNKTTAKGESVQLFFKYVKDLSKQEKNIDQVYLFCSNQNLSWNKYIQTIQYKRFEDNKEFLENYKQKQPCIDYIKKFQDKTSLNIFCFNKVDHDVRKFYEDLKKQTKCIKQLQFMCKEQFKNNFDLYCSRIIGQALKNTPNKK